MQIFRRAAVLWLDITVHGKRHRLSLHTDENALALERARDKARELEHGGVPGTGLTFLEFEPKYMAWARETKPRTARTEACHLKAIIAYLGSQGITRLDEVTPYHVEQFRVWIRGQDRRTHPKKDHPPVYPGKATANRYCALLRKLYSLARDWEVYNGPNPVSKVKFYKESPRVEILSTEDLDKIMTAAGTITAKPESPVQRVILDLITLAANTGLRKSEVLNLRWRDFRNDEIEVKGKGEKVRRVPLNDVAQAVIEKQSRINPFVFDVPNRGQADALRLTVKRIRTLSGIQGFHFHQLRHYFTSALLAAGADLQTISELLGHSKIMTSLIYSHSTPQRRRDAVGLLGTKPCHRPSDVKSANSG